MVRILLIGLGPGFDWANEVLKVAISASGEERGEGAAAELVGVNEPLSPAMLSALLAEPIDALVLVDHQPFAAGPPQAEAAIQAARGEASWAIAALELARRSVHTLRLKRASSGAWPVALNSLLDKLLTNRTTSSIGRYAPKSQESVSRSSAVSPARALPVSTTLSLPTHTVDALATAQATLDSAIFAPPLPALVSGYLWPLFEASGSSELAQSPLALSWPRDCFLHGDNPGIALPDTVEIAGRGRILAYGPYFPLPAGHWKATVWLGFSPEVIRFPFIVEIDTGDAITRGFFEVERGGLFTLAFDFQVSAPLGLIELRLISQDSALEGLTSLIEVGLAQTSF